MEIKVKKKDLDKLFRKYNRRGFVSPDPLEFLYRYDNPADREIVGMVASSMAYGRVAQILNSLEKIFSLMGTSPIKFTVDKSPAKTRKTFEGFKHRWTTGDDIAGLIASMQTAIGRHGSLEKAFLKNFKRSDENILPALESFTEELRQAGAAIVPSPKKGSACKKLNLYLRWLVRKDNVDPGGWDQIPSSKLIIPLDTHMHKIGVAFGMIKGKQANMKTAVMMTRAFANFAPKDPVKYDFVLTRLGIRGELSMDDWLKEIRGKK